MPPPRKHRGALRVDTRQAAAHDCAAAVRPSHVGSGASPVATGGTRPGPGGRHLVRSCGPGRGISGKETCGGRAAWPPQQRTQLARHISHRLVVIARLPSARQVLEFVNVIEMNFLPDVYVQCDVCKGARFNRETLQVTYKGHTIADVLEMTVEQAADVFSAIPQAADRLTTLVDVGLGYVKLGQPAPTLSGGEAQRVKLATELSRRATGKTLYLIDEPTTGLSFYDVHKLMDVIQRLVDKGNSVICIEHNLDVIRCSDWIIDLGPEGGNKGGQIVVTGTPEEVAQHETSHTGRYLKQVLEQHPPEFIEAAA